MIDEEDIFFLIAWSTIPVEHAFTSPTFVLYWTDLDWASGDGVVPERLVDNNLEGTSTDRLVVCQEHLVETELVTEVFFKQSGPVKYT